MADCLQEVSFEISPIEVMFEVEDVEVTISPIGEKGDPGTDGTAVEPIAFSYGDAAGTVWTAPGNGWLTFARVDVETSFNGADAAIEIGTLAYPGLIVTPADVDLSQTRGYEVLCDVELTGGTQIRIAITPGAGATQGDGHLFLDFVPTA